MLTDTTLSSLAMLSSRGKSYWATHHSGTVSSDSAIVSGTATSRARRLTAACARCCRRPRARIEDRSCAAQRGRVGTSLGSSGPAARTRSLAGPCRACGHRRVRARRRSRRAGVKSHPGAGSRTGSENPARRPTEPGRCRQCLTGHDVVMAAWRQQVERTRGDEFTPRDGGQREHDARCDPPDTVPVARHTKPRRPCHHRLHPPSTGLLLRCAEACSADIDP